MKKTVLCLGILTALGGLSAVFLLSPVPSDTARYAALSQSDTQIDHSSPRDLLDYFISTLGERDLNQVEQSVARYHDASDGLLVDKTLFGQFVLYKQALSQLEYTGSGHSLTLDELENLNAQILALQRQFFTPQEQKRLFDDENRLRALALEKRRIQSVAADEHEAELQWQTVLADQPGYIRRSEQNASLMGQLSDADKGDDQSRYLKRAELIGDAGAQRLAELDNEREAFSQVLEAYLEKRTALLTDSSLGQGEKESRLLALRESSFAEKQWRRVESLERLRDQIRNQIRDQIRNQIRNQIRDQIRDQKLN